MTRIKAKFYLIMVGLLWLRLILAQPEIIPLTIALVWNKDPRYKKYVKDIWLADDQAVNAKLGGNPDVSVSSKVGFMSNKFGQHEGVRPSMTARAMETFIDWGFRKLTEQQFHCSESYEADEEHYSYFWR